MSGRPTQSAGEGVSPHQPRPASVCVYCGSSIGSEALYADAARELGAFMAAQRVRLVFGGGSVGLMGVLADAVLAAGGEVIGVIPRGLHTAELAHPAVTQMITVGSMHARKQRMVELADAFIALPGGIGTLDELFETWTWLQLGIHRKPVGLLNVAGYYDALLDFLRLMSQRGFLAREHFDCLIVDTDVQRLLSRLAAFDQAMPGRWVQPDAPSP
jgi:uncharacterized protein (TIGR00730 family)